MSCARGKHQNIAQIMIDKSLVMILLKRKKKHKSTMRHIGAWALTHICTSYMFLMSSFGTQGASLRILLFFRARISRARNFNFPNGASRINEKNNTRRRLIYKIANGTCCVRVASSFIYLLCRNNDRFSSCMFVCWFRSQTCEERDGY